MTSIGGGNGICTGGTIACGAGSTGSGGGGGGGGVGGGVGGGGGICSSGKNTIPCTAMGTCRNITFPGKRFSALISSVGMPTNAFGGDVGFLRASSTSWFSSSSSCLTSLNI